MSDFSTLIAVIVGYVAVLTIATLLAQPIRLRLVVIVDDMLREQKWNKAERNMLEFFSKSCNSSTVGLLMPVVTMSAFVTVVIAGLPKINNDLTNFEKDDRHNRILSYYLISIAGSSPFASLISIPIFLGYFIASTIRGGASADVMDNPLKQMSTTYRERFC